MDRSYIKFMAYQCSESSGGPTGTVGILLRCDGTASCGSVYIRQVTLGTVGLGWDNEAQQVRHLKAPNLPTGQDTTPIRIDCRSSLTTHEGMVGVFGRG